MDVAADPVAVALRAPERRAFGEKRDVAERLLVLERALVEREHDRIDLLPAEQAPRIETLDLAVVGHDVGARQPEIVEVRGGPARRCADRARIDAIVCAAVADDQHARRLPLDVGQLVEGAPDGEDRAIALQHGVTVQGEFDTRDNQHREPEGLADPGRQTQAIGSEHIDHGRPLRVR